VQEIVASPNFGSVDSMTRKNLSELAIENRSTLNTG
jgi:hypothetical protein